MKNKQIAKTIIISGVASLLSYLITFFLTPYITENIGIEAYGFVTLSKTVVGYVDIIMTALTAFIVRYISVAFHKNRLDEARSYYSSSIIACLILSLFILFTAIIITLKLDHILNIPNPLVCSVKILFLLVFVNFFIVTLNVPLSAFAYIKNRLDITGIIKIIGCCVEALVLVILVFLCPLNIWFEGMGILSASIVILICTIICNKKFLPELYFKKKNVEWNKIRTLFKAGSWNSLNSLGNTLNSGLDLIISNAFLSGTATGQIAIAKTLGGMLQTIFIVIAQSFQPQLLKSYSSNEKDDFLKDIKKAMAFCGMFANIVFAGFVSLGKIYYKLWIPNENTQLIDILTVITIANYVTDGLLQPVYYVNTITVKNKMPCLITIIGGILNICGMLILIEKTNWGAYAIVSTTAAIMLIINLLFNPIYVAKILNIKCSEIYSVIVMDIVSCILMVIIFALIERLISPEGWIMLIVSAAVMFCIGCIIHVLVMHRYR